MDKIFEQTFQQRHWMASRHMKRHSTSLVIREMQVGNNMRHHIVCIRMDKMNSNNSNN